MTNVIANTSPGCFFLQGEPQENSCRESLSEALGGLGVLVCMAWVAFFYERVAETSDGLGCSMHFFAESEKVQHIKID